MMGLTVKQPRATLIERGLTNWTLQPEPTDYRGDLVICSAETFDQPDHELLTGTGPIAKALWNMRPDDVPRGVVICVATLEGCVPTSGGFAWMLSGIRKFPRARMPELSGQGLWEVPWDMQMVARQVLAVA